MNTISHFWQDRPVFVTGATGLVGNHVVRQLVDLGANVVCLVRDWVPQSELIRSSMESNVVIIRGELENLPLLERVVGEYEINTVIHLAAQAIVGIANRNPLSTFESNVRGTWNLLEAVRKNTTVKQVVVASSDKAYGDQPSLPYTEDMPLLAKHPYDVSKACADLITQSYFQCFNVPVCISRCGNFYGGGDLNWNRIIPGTIRSVIRGQPPVIRSDGSLIRDYFYVEDGAKAYLSLAEKMSKDSTIHGESFNFSTDEPLSVLAVTNKILEMMNSTSSPIILNETNNEILEQSLLSTKARTMLAWEPIYTLEQGLQKTIDWYTHFLKQ